jgi:glycosyltransferase involved in cell wall biosynthesis
MLKILYIAGTELFASHGGSVHTWEVATELARRGHTVTLIAAKTSGARHERIPRENLSVVEVPMHLRGVIAPICSLPAAWAASKKRPDVIIERLAIPGGAGAIASRFRKIPLVLDVNGPAPLLEMVLKRHLVARLPVMRQFLGCWTRFQYRRASAVFTANPTSIPAWFKGRAETIDLGVAIDRFTPDMRNSQDVARLKERLGLGGKFVIFYAGAFMNWQGFNVLPQAIEKVCASDKNVVFLLLGRGDEFEPFKAKITLMGLGEKVILPGSVSPDELPVYAACVDAGIAPYQPPEGDKSFYFGSPLKVFEYMAAGLPVVTTNCPPLPEIVKDGDTGFLVPPHDPSALAAAILRLAGNPELAREMGRRNRDIAVREYSWSRHVDKLEALLMEIIHKEKPRA